MKNPHKTPAVAATLMLMPGSAAGPAQTGDRHMARARQGPNAGSVPCSPAGG